MAKVSKATAIRSEGNEPSERSRLAWKEQVGTKYEGVSKRDREEKTENTTGDDDDDDAKGAPK